MRFDVYHQYNSKKLFCAYTCLFCEYITDSSDCTEFKGVPSKASHIWFNVTKQIKMGMTEVKENFPMKRRAGVSSCRAEVMTQCCGRDPEACSALPHGILWSITAGGVAGGNQERQAHCALFKSLSEVPFDTSLART
jgi:hypothetical protein